MRVLCMGETLLRYSTPKGMRMHDLQFNVHVGGSETNIAVSLSTFGFDSQLFTKLGDNFLGEAILRFLHSYQVDTSKVLFSNERIGSYYLESGSGNRTSQVLYDRANSAMTTLKRAEVDIPKLFEGVDAFVVSGITVALSSEIKELVLMMMKYCNMHQITVVYDSNYRAKLWPMEEAGEALKELLPYVNILSAGYLDAQNLLGLSSEKEDFEGRLQDFYQQMTKLYPQITYLTCTKRDIISTSVNDLTGYLYHQGQLYVSPTYHIDDIVDRVGGGDAHFSGLLYGLFNQKPLAEALKFACCASVLKHTVMGDANQFTVQEIEAFMQQGTSRIFR